MKLSKNLSRHEMACKCGCGFDTVDFELVGVLQGAVDYLEEITRQSVRLEITGPNRCKDYNDSLRLLWNQGDHSNGAKTAPKSQHIYGRAADFKLFFRKSGEQIPPNQIADYLEGLDSVSVGRYTGRTHVDTRTEGGKRWG